MLNRMSASVTENIGISTATKVMNTKIWAESMQEKAMYISTDLLRAEYG